MGVRGCCWIILKTSSTKPSYIIFILWTTTSYWSASVATSYTPTGSSNKAKLWNANCQTINTIVIQLTKNSMLNTSSTSSKNITRWLGEKSTGRYGHLLMYTNVDNAMKFIILAKLKGARSLKKTLLVLYIHITLSLLENFWTRNGKIITFNFSTKL